MTSVEFGKKCRPYIMKYVELFGEAPSPSEYAANREQFLEALQKACEIGNRIDNYLERLSIQEGVR